MRNLMLAASALFAVVSTSDQKPARERSNSAGDALTLRRHFKGIDDPYSRGQSPDATIAAGPSSLVLARNTEVAILGKKDGTVLVSKSMPTFFVTVTYPNEGMTDPIVIFDPHSNRFFLVVAGIIPDPDCLPGSCIAHYLLAVSRTAEPQSLGETDWYFYALDRTLNQDTPTANKGDFDHIGVTNESIVITSNQFRFQDESPQGVKIRLLNKATLIAGEPILTWTDFVGQQDPLSGGVLKSRLLPAIHFGEADTFFMVNATPCGIVLWGLKNLDTTPTLSSRIAVQLNDGEIGCGIPIPEAIQPGGAPLDIAGIGFNASPIYRDGRLWIANVIGRDFGSEPVSAIWWMELNVSDWPWSVRVVQNTVFGQDGDWHFAPAIMVDAAGNLSMVYARSSRSQFASAYITGRQAIDLPNTLRPPVLLKGGTATLDLRDPTGRNRFTDYFDTALDPRDGSTWMVGMYAKTQSTTGTWVGNVMQNHRLHFAQFGDGQGISSTLLLVNPSSNQANGSVAFYKDAGTPMSVDINDEIREGAFSFSIPPRGSAFFATDGVGSLSTGSVQVAADVPIGGTILFSGDFGVAGVGAAQPTEAFLVPVELQSAKGISTGLALANPSSAQAEVTLLLRDSTGEAIPGASVQIELLQNGQVARFPQELFDVEGLGIDLSDFRGVIEVRASSPVVGMAIRVSPGHFATLPVTALEE